MGQSVRSHVDTLRRLLSISVDHGRALQQSNGFAKDGSPTPAKKLNVKEGRQNLKCLSTTSWATTISGRPSLSLNSTYGLS